MTALSKLRSPHWLNWRAARWVALAAAIPALWACNNRSLEAPIPSPQQTNNDLFQQQINRKIDILFMVDNSSSMMPLQNKLIQQFPSFTNVLKGPAGGAGLPDLHLAVISSSMGAGQEQGIAQCPVGGDHGQFQSAPLYAPACAKASLMAGQTFISNIGGMANYTGDISDVFSCIALLGEGGCGFEHQFASTLRALGADGAAAPPSNNGFLRADAYLAVILITNEDDCSAPPTTMLFNQNSQLVSDPLGPLQSYRCNEFGHLCKGAKPPRLSMAGQMANLTGTCVSAEDGIELRVADVVTSLKKVKTNPANILVAAIAGPPAPYIVGTTPPTLDDPAGAWPVIEHSCTQADGTYGDPAVRINQFVSAFQGNGIFETICNDNFSQALQGIADLIGKKIGAPCVNGNILDTKDAPWTAADTSPPDCTVIDHAENDQSSMVVDTPVPQCANNSTTGATTRCWALSTDAMNCPGAHTVVFGGAAVATTTSLNSSVSCAVRACPPAGSVPNPPAGCQ
ncbi:MAG TPA: hypothetical protein VH560_06930 [Polyangia bacterium]|nr:hypothetical protein [Polyangia bacterium]